MEETLIPDVTISNSKLVVNKKAYAFHCKRRKKEEAEAIRDDLIASGCDAISRKGIVDYDMYHMVWWRKK